MKLLLADIHYKLGQKNVPKAWAHNRYKLFAEQVASVEDQVDTIIIPGDIFDRSPTLEELGVYFDFISQRSVPTIISTGNHESTKKGKSFFSELKEVTERLNPLVEIVVDYIKETPEYYVVPYEYIKKESTWSLLEPKYIFSHFRAEIPPHVKPEIPLEWLDKFPTVFAGDLHSHSNSQGNIVYPGSPMTTSFHRSETDTGYILIEDDWSWTWNKFDLPQLIRKTVSDTKDMIATDFHHTIYELEGNLLQLSNINNSDLLDKKIVKRADTETKLVLSKKMTMKEKLFEYLSYVLELSEKEVRDIMEVYGEYSKTSQD